MSFSGEPVQREGMQGRQQAAGRAILPVRSLPALPGKLKADLQAIRPVKGAMIRSPVLLSGLRPA